LSLLIQVVLLFLSLSICSGKAFAKRPSCDSDRTIRFGGLDWDSNAFHVEVARYLLEHGYDCKTDVIPGSSLPLLSALGRGDIDILMEVWIDNIADVPGRSFSRAEA
jgi:glycine betaine/proline transport system substrate-binding protein